MPAAETCNGLDDDCDGVSDEGTVGRDGGECCEPVPSVASALSMLFVIDNGGLVTPEQLSLAAELPWLLGALRTGDVDDDGEAEMRPFDRVRFGVVTTDMGTGGFELPTCNEPSFGDDGVLRTEVTEHYAGCTEAYPPFVEQLATSDSSEHVLEQLRCVIVTHNDEGCGIEQPLEAALKAVTPSTSDIRFFRDTTGHADGANAGFLEGSSAVAIVTMDDENDYSAMDPGLFDPSSGGSLLLRAFEHPEALHPTSRYVEGLLATVDAPAHLTFAVIAGIPSDVAPSRTADGHGAILAHPHMVERVDPADPNRLAPSCNTPGIGLAFPPVRLVEVARDLHERGAATAVGSLCQPDHRPPLRAMLESMALRAGAREACIGPR